MFQIEDSAGNCEALLESRVRERYRTDVSRDEPESRLEEEFLFKMGEESKQRGDALNYWIKFLQILEINFNFNFRRKR